MRAHVAVGLLVENLAVDLVADALVRLVEAHLLQRAPRAQQASAVRRRVVLQAHLEAVARQLLRRRVRDNLVANDLGADDLADDKAVGEPHDEAELWRLVLVLVLADQALARA